MKLQRKIITTTTPMIVTTIQTVTGKVWHVNPPRSVILTLEDNTNQEFKIPKDQKFNVDGQMVDAFALRKGMKVSATKIVEVPSVVSSEQQSVTGTTPQAPPTAEPPHRPKGWCDRCGSEGGRDEATTCDWPSPPLSGTRCSFARCPRRAHSCPGRDGNTCSSCRTDSEKVKLPSLGRFGRASGCNFVRGQKALKVQQVGILQGHDGSRLTKTVSRAEGFWMTSMVRSDRWVPSGRITACSEVKL